MHSHSAGHLPLLAEKMGRKIKASGLGATYRYELPGRPAGMLKQYVKKRLSIAAAGFTF